MYVVAISRSLKPGAKCQGHCMLIKAVVLLFCCCFFSVGRRRLCRPVICNVLRHEHVAAAWRGRSMCSSTGTRSLVGGALACFVGLEFVEAFERLTKDLLADLAVPCPHCQQLTAPKVLNFRPAVHLAFSLFIPLELVSCTAFGQCTEYRRVLRAKCFRGIRCVR